jgi:hypothetical protein
MKERKGGCAIGRTGLDQRKVMESIFTADFRFGTTKIMAERTDRRTRNFSNWKDFPLARKKRGTLLLLDTEPLSSHFFFHYKWTSPQLVQILQYFVGILFWQGIVCSKNTSKYLSVHIIGLMILSCHTCTWNINQSGWPIQVIQPSNNRVLNK